MAARGSRGARAVGRGAAACGAMLALLAAGCGASSGTDDKSQRAAPPEPAPVVSGLAAYVAESEGRTVVVTGALDNSSWRIHRVPGDPAPGEVFLAASTNGRTVAISVLSYSDDTVTSLHVLDVASGSVRRVPLPQARVRSLPAISSDGATVALAERSHLFVVPTGGGPTRRLAAALGTPGLAGTWLGGVRWSPDGSSLLYEFWQTDPDDPRGYNTSVDLVVLPLATPRPRALVPMPIDWTTVAWSPDSRRVAVAGTPGAGEPIELVAVRGGARSSVTGVFQLDLVWTRRGIYTFAGDRAQSTLILVNPDSHERRSVARRADSIGGTILAPPSGDVVGLLAWPRLRVFSATGERLLDRTLRGASGSRTLANGNHTVVLVDR